MTAAQLSFLAAAVFFAGFVDALAGGGGLITLPAYLAAGLPPALLLGTNKLSSSIGTVASAVRYGRTLKLNVRSLAPWIAASLLGSFAGARLALLLSALGIRLLVLCALPVVAYAVWSRHAFGEKDESAALAPPELFSRGLAVAFAIGAYDGFFGPGTGTFFALGFARLCRFDLLRATATSKALNLASNVAAAAFFLWAGRVDVRLGAIMGLASLGGHYAGSHVGLRKGSAAIRPMIVLVCLGLFAKLFYDVAVGR